jgi:hypothetical protein
MKKILIALLLISTIVFTGGCSSQKESTSTSPKENNSPNLKQEDKETENKINTSQDNSSPNKTLSQEVETKIKYTKMGIEDEGNTPNAKKKYEKITNLEDEYNAGRKTAEEVIKELDIIKNSN